jgi:cytochrome c oxidase subunit 2
MRRLLPLLSCAFAVAAAGCRRPQSSLYGQGPAADKIAGLSWLMIILFAVITVVMWFLIVLPLRKNPGSFDEHAPIDIGGGQGWLAYGGFLFPVIVLTIVFVLGLGAMAQFPLHAGGSHSMAPDIRITGHQWWWEVTYLGGDYPQHFKTANEIHIPVGRPVNIELESADVIHSFWVPGLHGKVDLVPRWGNYIRIEADQAGTFSGTCAEYCGAQHAHMGLVVIAQPEADYQAWLDGQIKGAAPPEGDDAKRGAAIFMSGPCSNCHAIRGTLAQGHVAPDLTHLASRGTIAAHTLPNDTAHLAAWVTHAQSLKPKVAMPDLTQFNGQQLRDLVAYLQQLK